MDRRRRCVEVRVSLADDARMAYALADPGVLPGAPPPGQGRSSRRSPDQRAPASASSSSASTSTSCTRSPHGSAHRSSPEDPDRRAGETLRAFRLGEEPPLVLSKVGNFAIDLPDASV